MNKTLKLGTRQSLLATAQSRAIAERIEQVNPGTKVELVGIETQGDLRLDIPLEKMAGKEFFVAELDQALVSGQVDLTVHSMKDLSLERPPEITLAAIPARENPRDVVLFAANSIDKLKQGQPLRIGTSSPRRRENLPAFLAKALPNFGTPPRLKMLDIRGNVDTRISFLSLSDTEPKKMDAVVLAFAGLNRLWADSRSRQKLTGLLQNLRWMILPLKEFPTAPAQGALAIECRSDDTETRSKLAKLHCPATAQDIARERKILEDWGGGCHQQFGATALNFSSLGSLLFIRGKKPDGSPVEEMRWQAKAPAPAHPLWDGTEWRESLFTTTYPDNSDIPTWLSDPGATFIAHARALPESWATALAVSQQRVWTSGTRSWFRLADQGVWVEGCAEQFGFDALQPTIEQKLLQLPDFANWNVLTHDAAATSWRCENVVATYAVETATDLGPEHEAVKALGVARSVFWTSGSQFELFKDWLPAGCQHACRYGKTYHALLNYGLDKLTPYPSVAAWRSHADTGN